MPLISFAEVRQLVDLDGVLEALNLAVVPQHRWKTKGMCPLGCCSSLRCCNYDFRRDIWYCHKCQRGGDQITLYQLVRGLSKYRAAIELCERACVPIPWLSPPLARNGDGKRDSTGEREED